MAKKKIFRPNMLIDYVVDFIYRKESCPECPINDMCKGDKTLCINKTEEAKKAIIDKFSTVMEVVDSEDD